jgi:hypothetical protein
MKAIELRIGNWVIDGDGDENQVEEICPYSCGKNDFRWDWLKSVEPIPLTKEWLFRFGFSEYKKKYKKTIKNIFLISESNGIGVCYNKIDEDYEIWLLNCDYELKFMPRWVKHVHQLQNLYFALTGEELEEQP